ncbi:MAG: formate dehydrogenase subunit delta [Hyphomicrobiales bacterium]|nr:formate dehydrogenase subunit delta [Hyphomicrobiales bacterium]
MSLDKFVYMANQIASFFVTQGQETAAASTADHIKKFWDPRMRAAIIAHLKAGGAGLDPVARSAIQSLPEVKVGSREATQTQ